MKKFLARFVEEARDQVISLNEGILRLERCPDDTEILNTIFRSAHTIKGSSRMMKLAPITEVAHKMEDILGALRDKKIEYASELGDLLLRGTDIISDMIEMVASGRELPAEKSPLCDILANAAEGNAAAFLSEKNDDSSFSAAAPPIPRILTEKDCLSSCCGCKYSSPRHHCSLGLLRTARGCVGTQHRSCLCSSRLGNGISVILRSRGRQRCGMMEIENTLRTRAPRLLPFRHRRGATSKPGFQMRQPLLLLPNPGGPKRR